VSSTPPPGGGNDARTAGWFAFASAFVMIAQQVGGKSARDALFLASFAAEDLPKMVMATAVASMLAVVGATRLFARFGPFRVVPYAFLASGTLFALEFLLQPSMPRVIAVLLYLHTASFGALVISGFWSVVNERFDPHAAKQLMGRVGAGATAGGVIGGLIAQQVGTWLDAHWMLLVQAGLNAVAAFGVLGIGTKPPRAPVPDGAEDVVTPESVAAEQGEEASTNGLALIAERPYLRGLAGLVFLTNASGTLVDYAFKATAADQYVGGSELLSFFATFHTGTALLSFLVQTIVARATLARVGVAGSAALLPGAVLLTASGAAILPNLASVVIARATELVLANSIFRSGYELLYTPVPPWLKRPTKLLIDVAGNRIGDAGGSLLVLLLLAWAPEEMSWILAAAAVTALLALVVARRLHQGYVAQLASNLRSGSGRLPEAAVMDAATLQTLSTLGLDRDALFEQLAATDSWSQRLKHPAVDGVEDTHDSAPSVPDAPAEDPIHEAARLLRSGDAQAIRAFLREETPLDGRLASHVVALLARRDLHREAIVALRAIADEATPVLVEAIADGDQPFAIRRRLPRVLEQSTRPEAVEGLRAALEDPRFEVRYRSAIALARICRRSPELSPPSEEILQRVEWELETGRSVWEKRRLLDDDSDEDAPLLDRALRDRVNRSVEHVFTLLSLTFETEPLRLSLFALAGEDSELRGTALEYLESVLPERTRNALFPLLHVRVEIRRRRTRAQLVDELVRSVRNLDASQLQEAIAESRRPPPPDDADADADA
jgi:AAA family ATP:ADP antiporter